MISGIKQRFFLFFLVVFSTTVSAQYISVDESDTAEQLVRDVLIQNNPCITISNVNVSGYPAGSGNSYGRFFGNGSTFPFNEGIILSTGKAASAVGPNTTLLSEGPTSWLGDSDLEQALGVGNTINATVLEFDFLPLASKISFDYIFSSEQYLSNPSPNQCNFTDGFAFLIRPLNSTQPYQNLAVIKNTTIPVRVNTVRGPGTICPAANAEYFDAFNGTQHPTNFNGQTKILTAEKNDIVPGTLYHIKLVVADQGNNLYDSAIFLGAGSFKIEKDLGEDRLISNGNPLCFGETLTLDATESGTNNSYAWYKDNILQPETTATYNVTSAGIYRAEVTINATACKLTGEVTIEYATPIVLNNATIFQCDENNDGTTVFNLKKADTLISADPGLSSPVYYENITDTTPIATPQSYTATVPKTIYARVSNSSGCSQFTQVSLQISNTSVTPPSPIETCDDDNTKDGLHQFNLNTEVTPVLLQGLPAGLTAQYYKNVNDALIEINPLNNIFENSMPYQEIIWGKITNGPDCYDIVPVTLVVHVFNDTNFQDEEAPLCSGSFTNLDAPPGFVSYLWDDINSSITSRIRVTAPGDYHVTATDSNGCSATKKFTVKLSEAAAIASIEINDFRGDKNTVMIIATGTGDYEYSLDGNNYQDESLFTNVLSGQYTVYVNDKNECGITTRTIFVLDYPKFFTPNNDGHNDFWKIPFLYQYPLSKISVFDRYGKLVYASNGNDAGWDGKLNSKPLPSTDYWFEIVLESGRIIKGHFALKR